MVKYDKCIFWNWKFYDLHCFIAIFIWNFTSPPSRMTLWVTQATEQLVKQPKNDLQVQQNKAIDKDRFR